MISKICEYCNKKYYRYPSTVVRARFCSTKCRHKSLTEELRKQRNGKNNPAWKGGRIITNFNYIKIHSPSHPFCDVKGYVPEHRLIMEKHLGRHLLPIEVIHHINNNKQDNVIENLMLFSSSGEHTAHHHEIKRNNKKGKK